MERLRGGGRRAEQRQVWGEVSEGGSRTHHLTNDQTPNHTHHTFTQCHALAPTRMLGLLKVSSSKSSSGPSASDDGPPGIDDEVHPSNSSKPKKPWMDPITFCAYHYEIAAPTLSSSLPLSPSGGVASSGEKNAMDFSSMSIDVPAWVEVMHRTKRKRILAYVVRAVPREDGEDGNR